MNGSEITGLVLAGGQARRMGGMDKGLLEIDGLTMAERIAGKLSEQCAIVLINANRNTERYRRFGYRVIQDELDGFQGPLAGMLSGLRQVGTDWMITAPCDGPFLSDTYARSMLEAAESAGSPIAVASDETRLQPVYALLHKSTGESLEDYLSSGNRKIDSWYALHRFATVQITDCEDMFENINTPEQLENCRKKVTLSN
ncbi:MAG: molybdenum cofactor guanylyltransferase [Gammaproteobacteria bacterium]|nr:molybdenum cofactor guanylyltransferase [Gammaproteobacteria bacterium]MYD76056.1 molybdenum cofactor guanylyltransferase [Gammaproteobacteria bacterium]MYJ52075.1 molybdenum cofactor guanylyltransferase [Gammaproteobacteria bacterium]